jgi:hypothetical protein
MTSARPDGGRSGKPTRRLRRWQFGLPAMFGLMTLVAGVLTWRTHQIDAQRQAVQAIHKVRGAVFYHKEDPGLLSKLERAWFNGQARPEYITFRLSHLMYEHPEKLAEIQPHLRQLGSLRRLSLEGTAIGDEQLSLLEELTQLDELNLRGTLVSAEGVQRLRQRLPGCRVIHE